MAPSTAPPSGSEWATPAAFRRTRAGYSAATGSRQARLSLTADALLTQRKLADYLLARDAHVVLTVKDNQPNLLANMWLCFAALHGQPDFREPLTLAYGRIEPRKIRIPAGLNEKKTGKTSSEAVYGVISHAYGTADAVRVLGFNRAHWTVEYGCHYTLDWNWDEDRCIIRTGHGPANTTALPLRRFAIGVIKARSRDTVSAAIQPLARNGLLVFDGLRMTEKFQRRSLVRLAQLG